MVERAPVKIKGREADMRVFQVHCEIGNADKVLPVEEGKAKATPRASLHLRTTSTPNLKSNEVGLATGPGRQSAPLPPIFEVKSPRFAGLGMTRTLSDL